MAGAALAPENMDNPGPTYRGEPEIYKRKIAVQRQGWSRNASPKKDT